MCKKIYCYVFIVLLSLSWAVSSWSSEIIIGLDADMSTVAVEGGTAIKRGAELAIDEINEAGGVLGRQLKLEVRDHRGNPARGLANIKYFSKNDNVIAVLGGVHTPVALHELPAIHEHKLIYLGPWAAGTSIIDNNYQPNYVFRLSVRDADAGYVLANYAKRNQLKKIGLLLERTGWGRSNEKSMSAAAEKIGLSITAVEWFNWRERSMADQINRLIKSGAEGIFLVANAPEGALVVNEMASREPSSRLPIYSHWGLANSDFVKMAGIDNILLTDIKVLQSYSFLSDSNQQKSHKLLQSYRNKYDKSVTAETIPSPVGVIHAYDLVHLLVIAINRAGTADSAAVREALENIESYQGAFKHFKYPFSASRHDALKRDDYIMSRYNTDGYLVPIEK